MLDLACKGPNRLFSSCDWSCPTCFRRKECDNLVMVSLPIVTFSDTSGLCMEIKLELIRGHVAKLRTTNNNKYIPGA